MRILLNVAAKSLLRVFVYGTLKRGQANHRRLCSGYLDVQSARVWGRLYQVTNQNYPMLVVPDESVVWRGTGNLTTDLQQLVTLDKQQSISPLSNAEPGWNFIEGELLTFDNAADRLSQFDELEGFHADGSDEYVRILLRTVVPQGQLVWAYVAPPGWPANHHCLLGSTWNGV